MDSKTVVPDGMIEPKSQNDSGAPMSPDSLRGNQIKQAPPVAALQIEEVVPEPAAAKVDDDKQHAPQKLDPGFRMTLCFMTLMMLIFAILVILLATMVEYD